jgi:hypothetical protein
MGCSCSTYGITEERIQLFGGTNLRELKYFGTKIPKKENLD